MSRGTYFRRCPICGCALDPGERCDCQEKDEELEPVTSRQKKPEMAVAAVAS